MYTTNLNIILYLCRCFSFFFYIGQLLWNRWAEEWVVLYDDSTMAWFTVSVRNLFYIQYRSLLYRYIFISIISI